MNITCPHCQARLNLPDDKIPKNRDTSFKCPKCQQTVPLKASGTKAAPAQETRPARSASHKADALVCMADTPSRARVMAALDVAGWAAEPMDSVEKALKTLEYQVYPLVLMDGAFDLEGKMIQYFNELDMSLRRQICLVMIRQDFHTGDAMTAMNTSCNYVVNTSDLEIGGGNFLVDILAVASTDHENFYKVYTDSMRITGKA